MAKKLSDDRTTSSTEMPQLEGGANMGRNESSGTAETHGDKDVLPTDHEFSISEASSEFADEILGEEDAEDDVDDVERQVSPETLSFQKQMYQLEIYRLESEYYNIRTKLSSVKRILCKMEQNSEAKAAQSFEWQHEFDTTFDDQAVEQQPEQLLQLVVPPEKQTIHRKNSNDRVCKQAGEGRNEIISEYDGSGHLTRRGPRKKTRHRRWSLSSTHKPEMGELRRLSEHGETEVLLHDEWDAHHASSRGLHRRGGNPRLYVNQQGVVGLRGNKLSDNDLPSLEDRYSEDDETAMLVPRQKKSRNEPKDVSFWDDLKDRAGWLVGLMVLQSMSSFIIQRNERLLQDHIVIVQFLTMLVGAGGNAGNQASVRVIRGLAVGTISTRNLKDYLSREFTTGLTLACILAVSGCIRAVVFKTPLRETASITMSLWCIVFISISIGALLPLTMKYVGIDPAHSSTSIQVIMDITGVAITVYISQLILA